MHVFAHTHTNAYCLDLRSCCGQRICCEICLRCAFLFELKELLPVGMAIVTQAFQLKAVRGYVECKGRQPAPNGKSDAAHTHVLGGGCSRPDILDQTRLRFSSAAAKQHGKGRMRGTAVFDCAVAAQPTRQEARRQTQQRHHQPKKNFRHTASGPCVCDANQLSHNLQNGADNKPNTMRHERGQGWAAGEPAPAAQPIWHLRTNANLAPAFAPSSEASTPPTTSFTPSKRHMTSTRGDTRMLDLTNLRTPAGTIRNSLGRCVPPTWLK